MTLRTSLLIAPLFLLAACWNGGNVAVRLGDVSLGQQLIDLKTAYEAEAITEDEYESSKEALLAINSLCEEPESSWF